LVGRKKQIQPVDDVIKWDKHIRQDKHGRGGISRGGSCSTKGLVCVNVVLPSQGGELERHPKELHGGVEDPRYYEV
jgi:hypothetical protein